MPQVEWQQEIDAIRARLARCMVADRRRIAASLDRAGQLFRRGEPADRLLAQAAEAAERSSRRAEQRRGHVPAPEYPAGLPVVEQREVIKAAISQRQVVVICGETGSGKTTQLPKICLELGRGVTGLIGHTQPRRIAARSVAARIAEELGTSLGRTVGYKVRFSDKTSPDGYIKLMTDGILLAETQTDRRLEQYDTIIIDEAHERSLNIDFLLGYLRQLLPQRPDLKVIITSATIDPERFAKHFADGRGPAPIVEVSGRTYPVEVRYRPLVAQDEDEQDRDMERGVLDAIDELAGADPMGHGDVLVFLSGEREIREAAEALRKHHPPQTQILPLYARLSADEQMRVFHPHPHRRIVLATNVAETSLTVPGIRYVVDPGYARISRYSPRTKVQGLPIEPVSQASANQRAGRCGRLADGVCIRLYAEEDYQSRPRFTEPEILRTNLAAVILQMKALRLGAIEQFPFVEPPEARMIRDGYDTLRELGAVDESGELTRLGVALARLPIDPRLGRMILAGEKEGALTEVLVIASALSVQDPRERPLEKHAEADGKHEQFRDERSDFISFLKLWAFFHENEHKLSGSKLRRTCKENFVSFMRMREWHDVHKQLHSVLTEMGLRFNRDHATYEAIHRALLAGLLSNIGKRGENKHGLGEYDGTRGTGFGIFPGSNLFKRGPKWVMAGEIVRTTRVYARAVAAIEPEWIEQVGSHLVKSHVFEPHWRRDRAQPMAYEKVTLLGLEIVPKRSVLLARFDPKTAREIFIHHALVEGEYVTAGEFLAHNRGLVAEVKRAEAKVRRRDLLADQQKRFEFFDRRVPADVYDGRRFEKWREEAEQREPRLLFMFLADLLVEDQAGEVEKYPDELPVFGERLRIAYRYDPGAADDGATITVPVTVLGQLDPVACEKAVRGLAEEKVRAMVRALPKSVRKYVSEEMVRDAEREAKAQDGPVSRAVGLALERRVGIAIPWELWDGPAIEDHLRMNYRVVDEAGRPIAAGRDLGKLRRELGDRIRRGFLAVKHPIYTKDKIEDWDFGDLPGSVQIEVNGARLTAYPALHDEEAGVALRLFDTAHAATEAMRRGVKRLFVARAADEFRLLLKGRPEMERLVARYATIGPKEELRRDLEDLIAERAFDRAGSTSQGQTRPGPKDRGPPAPARSDAGPAPAGADLGLLRTQAEFQARLKTGRARVPDAARGVLAMADQLLSGSHTAMVKLDHVRGAAASNAVADIRMQLSYLMPRRFLASTPAEWLPHLPRYLRAIEIRIERLSGNGVERDAQRMVELAPLWWNYVNAAGSLGVGEVMPAALVEYRWMLEELRVSLFAQELGTAGPVSVKRLQDRWAKLRGTATT